MAPTPSSKNQALLDAQLELWHHALGYIKSVALKFAVDLRIADAIHNAGGTATLPELTTKLEIHQSKLPHLGRLMRVLIVTGVFSVEQEPTDGGSGELVYGLTPVSRLIVSSTSTTTSMFPLMSLMLDDSIWAFPFLQIGEWFQHELPDPSLFKMAHGQNLWDLTSSDKEFAKPFNEGMAADSGFTMDIIIKDYADVFHGVTSLVDVAGGHGGATQAISKAFPCIKCSVMDLPHAVDCAPVGTDVTYITGDMFQSIPSANVVLLKWVMHDWGDAECVKILQNCRKAIPPRDAGGKVIIVDIVIGVGASDQKHREAQVLCDLYIMCINGVERDEEGWKKIIFEAGFSDYKITPVLGLRSIIEVYP